MLRECPRHQPPKDIPHDKASHAAVRFLKGDNPPDLEACKDGVGDASSRQALGSVVKQPHAFLVVQKESEVLVGAPSRLWHPSCCVATAMNLDVHMRA